MWELIGAVADLIGSAADDDDVDDVDSDDDDGPEEHIVTSDGRYLCGGPQDLNINDQ